VSTVIAAAAREKAGVEAEEEEEEPSKRGLNTSAGLTCACARKRNVGVVVGSNSR
jgi:hypothetical protein